MTVDRDNVAQAFAALSLPTISTRDCVAVTLQDGTKKRFILDTVPQTLASKDYVEVPAGQISDLSMGAGPLADSTTLTLDGAQFITSSGTPESLFLELTATPLRDRPIQISTMVLDEMTAEPIGLIPIFVGFIDKSELDRSDRERGAIWSLRAASYRAYARRLLGRILGHDDHIQRWPGDGFLKHLSDTVFSEGKARWNTTQGSSSGSSTSGASFASSVARGFSL